MRLLDEAKFYELVTDDERFKPSADGSVMICLDGTTYTIEISRPNGYHAVERYCPDDRAFRAIGLYLLRLARFRIDLDAL